MVFEVTDGYNLPPQKMIDELGLLSGLLGIGRWPDLACPRSGLSVGKNIVNIT